MDTIPIKFSDGMQEELATAIQKYTVDHCEINCQSLCSAAERAYEEFMATIMNAEKFKSQLKRIESLTVDKIDFHLQFDQQSWNLWRQAFNLITDKNE